MLCPEGAFGEELRIGESVGDEIFVSDRGVRASKLKEKLARANQDQIDVNLIICSFFNWVSHHARAKRGRGVRNSGTCGGVTRVQGAMQQRRLKNRRAGTQAAAAAVEALWQLLRR